MPEPVQARIAVIGAGWWSQGWHLPHLSRHPGCQLVAIVDSSRNIRSTLNPDMEQLPALGERYGARTFTSHKELLEAGLRIDGVVVATSHPSHYEVGAAALAAGLHVFMEKPMTTDPGEARELLAAVRRSGRTMMVNNTANWQPQTRRAAEWVAAGRLGVVQHVSCYMGNSLLWLFEDPANSGWCFPSGSMTGNGMAWGQLSHTLAWVFRVTGLTPASVVAEMNYSERTGADMYDAALIRCTSGAIVCLQGVATLVGEKAKGGGDERPSGKQAEHKIFGSEGYLTYSGIDTLKDSGSLVLRRHDGGDDHMPGFDWEDGDQDGIGPLSLQAFIASCRGEEGIWNGADAEVGYKVVCTLDGMYRSAKNGGRREHIVWAEQADCIGGDSACKRLRSS